MDRILIGLDGSERAEGVLKKGVELARRAGGKVFLFRAVGVPIEVPTEAYAMSPDSLADLLQAEARKYLDKMVAEVPAELLMGSEVGIGTPWRSICAEAESKKADLIVIGSHGYSGIDRLIGTTAAKVVNHAHCSVFVVRD